MAGLNVTIDVNDKPVITALNHLLESGQNLRPAFVDIGEYLIELHEERFNIQLGADGKPWQPLSEKYQARKKRHQDMILVLNEHLANSWRYSATDTELQFGTDRVYAATHHFGDPSRGIPSRPIIGIEQNDQSIIDILNGHFSLP